MAELWSAAKSTVLKLGINSFGYDLYAMYNWLCLKFGSDTPKLVLNRGGGGGIPPGHHGISDAGTNRVKLRNVQNKYFRLMSIIL